MDYWSPANTSGTHATVHYSTSSFPNMAWSGYNESATTGGYNAKLLNHSWRKADFLRLKELSIGYTWMTPRVKQVIGVEAIKLYVTANNLLTFTKYLGSDPEATMTSTVLGQGIDLGRLPQSRSIVAGVKFNL